MIGIKDGDAIKLTPSIDNVSQIVNAIVSAINADIDKR